jgi:hypothetical protein
MIQLGICPVSWDPVAGKLPSGLQHLMRGHYSAKPFNFFVSPIVDPMFGFDRTFSCQSSAIEMLCRGGMDLNHLVRHGIRYLSHEEGKMVREAEQTRSDGVRDDILIDEGGQAFLETVKYVSLFPSPSSDMRI